MTDRRQARTASRVAAVQALFQSEQSGDSAETVIDQFVRHRLGDPAGNAGGAGGYEEGRAPLAEVKLFGRIVRAAVTRQDMVDRMIAETLPPTWPMARLDPVLRAVLRAGGGELAMEAGPTAKTVIVEYLTIASSFFDGDEPKMVNAALDRLARRLRPAEFAAPAATSSEPSAEIVEAPKPDEPADA